MMPAKRKSGERYPCGKLKQAEAPEQDRPTRNNARRALVDERLSRTRRDERFSGALGMWAYEKKITEREYEAGKRLLKLYDEYSRLQGFPPRAARSPKLERSPGRGFSDVAATPHAERVKNLWLAAVAALGAGRGREATIALCIDGDEPPWEEKKYVLDCLKRLVVHFRV